MASTFALGVRQLAVGQLQVLHWMPWCFFSGAVRLLNLNIIKKLSGNYRQANKIFVGDLDISKLDKLGRERKKMYFT